MVFCERTVFVRIRDERRYDTVVKYQRTDNQQDEKHRLCGFARDFQDGKQVDAEPQGGRYHNAPDNGEHHEDARTHPIIYPRPAADPQNARDRRSDRKNEAYDHDNEHNDLFPAHFPYPLDDLKPEQFPRRRKGEAYAVDNKFYRRKNN